MRESCLRGSVMRPGVKQTHEMKTFWRNEQVDEDILCRWGVCLSGAARAQPRSWAEKGWFSMSFVSAAAVGEVVSLPARAS